MSGRDDDNAPPADGDTVPEASGARAPAIDIASAGTIDAAVDERSDADTIVVVAEEQPDEGAGVDGYALQESPERAGRRVDAAGLRIGTRVALGLVVASLVPTALAASAVLVLSPVAAPNVTTPKGPPIAEVRAAREEIDAAAALLSRASADGAAEQQRLAESDLEAALAFLGASVGAVKAARTEDEAAADAPVTTAELSAALAQLGVTPEGSRWLTTTKNELLAPEGATLPESAAALPKAPAASVTTTVVDTGGAKKLLARGCVAGAGLCLLEERPVDAGPPSLERARSVVIHALALAPIVERGSPSPPPDIEPVRLRIVLGALLLSLFLSALVAWRLRRDVTSALRALDGRLRLLAAGQTSDRSSERRPRELSDLEDAVDALCATLGSARARDEADRRRADRLFALSEQADAVARGQLATRLSSSDDVAEATLAASVNRLIDAYERQVVRLKSHAELLSAGAPKGTFHDDNESDPAAVVAKRVAGLGPIPPLLTDISGRLLALSKAAVKDHKLTTDLARLSEAVAQRARAAQALFDALDIEISRLPRAGAGTSSLTADQQRALSKLVDDLESLSVDTSLPRLLESLPDLTSRDVASRLARAPTSA